MPLQAALAARRSQKSSKQPLSTQQRKAMMALAPATVQPAGALEPCADLLPSGLDDARRDAQAPGTELRIAPVRLADPPERPFGQDSGVPASDIDAGEESAAGLAGAGFRLISSFSSLPGWK